MRTREGQTQRQVRVHRGFGSLFSFRSQSYGCCWFCWLEIKQKIWECGRWERGWLPVSFLHVFGEQWVDVIGRFTIIVSIWGSANAINGRQVHRSSTIWPKQISLMHLRRQTNPRTCKNMAHFCFSLRPDTLAFYEMGMAFMVCMGCFSHSSIDLLTRSC